MEAHNYLFDPFKKQLLYSWNVSGSISSVRITSYTQSFGHIIKCIIC